MSPEAAAELEAMADAEAAAEAAQLARLDAIGLWLVRRELLHTLLRRQITLFLGRSRERKPQR